MHVIHLLSMAGLSALDICARDVCIPWSLFCGLFIELLEFVSNQNFAASSTR